MDDPLAIDEIEVKRICIAKKNVDEIKCRGKVWLGQKFSPKKDYISRKFLDDELSKLDYNNSIV